MTGEQLETLIYTDCRPGQGLQGLGGLQFQARSAPSAAAAEPVVRKFLLYEPPATWMAARRPVEDYPPSFAHVASGGLYATAAGLYLGKEANGSRQGNQLTHTVVTRTVDGYGTLRPAQLFDAGFWSTAPAGSTTSDPVPRDQLATTLTPARARDFVRAQPEGPDMLLSLVSALEEAGRPGAPRVLFVGADVPAIVQWLVAGTLLVPQARAMELGFKIFTMDPALAGVPVVAVQPDFAGPAARVDNQLGYAVFDLEKGRFSRLEATPTARRWVGMFLADNPRDVVDALDVAGMSGLRPEPTAAALGLAAIMHREPDPQHAEAIVGWLRTGPEQLRDAYAADIAEMFAESPHSWSREVLVLLDAVGCDGLIPGRVASVRLALMRSEVDAAGQRAEVADQALPKLPDGEWTAEDGAVAHRIVGTALNARGPAPCFEALLRVASRFGVAVDLDDLDDRGRAFVGYWAEHPNLDYDSSRWPCAGGLEQALVDELTRRVREQPHRAREVGTGWWRWLLPRLDVLDQALAAVTLGGAVLDGAAREDLVTRHLAAARTPDRFVWTVNALWCLTPPTHGELDRLRRTAPAGVTLPKVAVSGLRDRLLRADTRTVEELDLAHALLHARLLPAERHLLQVLGADEALQRIVRDLADGPVGSGDEAVRLVRDLAELPADLVRLRAGAVVVALARMTAPREVLEVLRRHPSIAARFAGHLDRVLAKAEDERFAVVVFYLAGRRYEDEDTAPTLGKALQQWTVRASSKSLQRVGDRLARIGPDYTDSWERYLVKLRPHRRLRRVTRPFGG